jgi:hypothetical protein
LLVIVSPAWAINIAWVSVHGTDTANAAAQGFGYTAAPDQGYVSLLRSDGHTVTRVVEQSPDAAYAANLNNNFDLIIAGRQVNSGNFQDDPERVLWHGISKPMIYMSGYVLRNNRLQFYTGDTIPDIANQAPVTLTASLPSHPIFQGVPLDAMNSIQFANYPVSTPAGNVQRGISINTDPIAGGGTALATSGTAGNGMGAPLITHWAAGSQLGANTLAGPRMVFLSGSREHDGGGVPTAGGYDLSPTGEQLFLNSVCFMVGGCGPPLVPGDTDGNGTVNFADFGPIQTNFRKSVTSRAQGDLVTNGVVDFADFRQWKGAFLGMGGSLAGLDLGFIANVPEPTTAGLVLLTTMIVGSVRCRRQVN